MMYQHQKGGTIAPIVSMVANMAKTIHMFYDQDEYPTARLILNYTKKIIS